MISDKFTPAQRAAIIHDRDEILVSASAGSGKTTVMIERILRLLSEGADLESMIVCTFTKASAADMRGKLLERLNEAADKGEPWAKTATEKLPLAEFSTIDSFCVRLCRNYFYHTDGIDPAFEVLETAAASALLGVSVEETVREKNESDDPDFAELYEVLTPNRKEKKLCDIIKRLYGFAMINPDPEDWLDRAEQSLYCHSEHIAVLTEFYEAQHPDFLRRSMFLRVECDALGFKACADSLAQFYDEVIAHEPLTSLSRTKTKNKAEADLYERYKSLRKEYKDFCVERLDALESADPVCTARHLGVLLEAVRAVIRLYTEKKQKKARMDFNDLEHAAYKILQNEAALDAINQKYRYLFVDEFQDINPLQDAIFGLLTAKRFYVGDVKQSIYGFRLSDPAIFIAKRNDCLTFGENGTKLAIELNANYRSDSGILKFCDKVFSSAMTQDFGGVDYAKSAVFTSGRGSLFTPSVVCRFLQEDVKERESGGGSTERAVYSVQKHTYETNDAAAKEREADFVAGHILWLKQQAVVLENGTTRAVAYKDISVLLRSAGQFADILCDKLRRSGVPVKLRKETSAEENPAVVQLLNYLRLVDNRRDDIVLASVLKSVFGGFCTDAELARIRAYANGRRDGEDIPFFAAADLYAKDLYVTDKIAQKLTGLFANLTRYERLSHVLSFSELSGRICAEHEYFKYVFAFPDGPSAAEGLSRFLDQLSELPLGSDISAALAAVTGGAVKLSYGGDSDAVQVMTIHAAKGLEFPFVILPNLSKEFNVDDIRKECILDSGLGAALKFFDVENRRTVKTSLWHRAKLNLRKKMLEEELRILYVALTRAQRQLVLVASKDKYVPKEGLNVACALDWLYRTMSPIAASDTAEYPTLSSAVKPKIIFSAPAPFLVQSIRRYTEFAVPPVSGAPVKLTVTRVARSAEGDTQPAYAPFVQKKDGTGAEVGEAYHRFLETVDYDAPTANGIKLFKKESPEYAPLIKTRQVEEAVAQIKKRIGGRKFYRELPFLYRLENGVLLQGVIDLLIEDEGGLEIIDYKTGKISSALFSSYAKQIGLYAESAERILKKTVLRKSIFLISAGEFVEV